MHDKQLPVVRFQCDARQTKIFVVRPCQNARQRARSQIPAYIPARSFGVAHFTGQLPTLFTYRRPLLTLTPSPSPSCVVDAFPSPSLLLPLITHLSAHLPPSSWPSPRSSPSLVEAAPRCRGGRRIRAARATSPSRTGGASEVGSGGATLNSSPCSPWPATTSIDA
jgi:hypothetical protein